MFKLAPTPVTGITDPAQVTVPDTSVTVLIVTAGQIHHRLHSGLVDTLLFDQQHGWNNYAGELINTSGANICKSRNEIIRRFLTQTDSEWAWLIDSDMVIKEDTLPRLLCAAEFSGAKIIGALCCMIGPEGPIPTIYQLGDWSKGEVTRVMLDYPDNTVMQVAGTGFGCLLIHRSVLEHFAQQDLQYPFVYEAQVNGQWVSEDLMFCLRANDAGFPVFVDTSTHVGHAKGSTVWWPEDIRKGRLFPTPWNVAIVPSKTPELAVQTGKQLAGQVDQIIFLDNTDDAAIHKACSDLDGALVVHMPGAGIHEMWNHGCDLAIERANQRRNINLFVLNDDLRFGPKFVHRMVEALRSDRDLAAVCGNYDGRTSDLLVEPTTDICAGRYDGSGGFAGFCFVMRGEWWTGGYRFPEECKWWFGDNDLVLAATASQAKVGIAIDAPVEHIDGGSKTGGDWSDFAEQIRADERAFKRRWGLIEKVPAAILTANYGGYDVVSDAVEQSWPCDWLLVTDTPCDVTGRKTIIRTSSDEPRHAARRPKFFPHEFTHRELVIWVDGRVVIKHPQFAEWMIHHLGDGDVAVWRHPQRSSIVAEAEAAAAEQPHKYNPDQLRAQAAEYVAQGHEDTDLWQLTIMVWRVNDTTRRLGERWWEEVEKWPGSIDQISFPVVAREVGAKVVDLPGGFWDHPGLFTLTPHADGT